MALATELPMLMIKMSGSGFESQNCIVKQVSWFKSSLLLRILIKYTHELQLLIKTKDSILIEKYIQQMREGNQAWLGLGFRERLYLN